MSEKQSLRSATSIDSLRLAVEQAAEARSNSHSHVLQRICGGAPPAHKDGRLTFIARTECHRSIAACKAALHPTEAIQVAPVRGVYGYGEVPPPRGRKPLRFYGLGERGPPAPNMQAIAGTQCRAA
jgi:hypothetical protein